MGVELARCRNKLRESFLLVTILSFPVSELYENITHAFFKQGMVSNQIQQEFQ